MEKYPFSRKFTGKSTTSTADDITIKNTVEQILSSNKIPFMYQTSKEGVENTGRIIAFLNGKKLYTEAELKTRKAKK